MVSNYSKEILKKTFDERMVESIKTFAKEISDTEADVYIVMARKAACFLRFLQRCGLVDISGIVVTDRVLDIDVTWIKDKNVVIIDDVIVSGTTIYRVIEKVRKANALSINVLVLGVTKSCNTSIFNYCDSNGITRNYLNAPYVSMTEAGCIKTCSEIVSTFTLDISPYDVDFPRHKVIHMSEYMFEKIMNHHEWKSYDVSSSLQAKYGIQNITLIPTDVILKKFDDAAGIPVSKMGFYKIRVFARKTNIKNKPIIINVVPYFLFNAISEFDTEKLFNAYFTDSIDLDLQTTTKIRLLQYVLAEKLYNIWISFIKDSLSKAIYTEIDKDAFGWIFPRSFFHHVEKAINKSISLENYEVKEYNLPLKRITSSIQVTDENKDNTAIIQSKLIEPFSKLYHEEEQKARIIVQNNGVSAFSDEQYRKALDRLNHGYSYQELIKLLIDFPEYYDKNTIVSLFLDEAIDTGIVVPIISREFISNNGRDQFIYYRAYRHGEDVPFGQEEEKKCAILLKAYYQQGGAEILSKIRVEKMLVLFLNIGIAQNLFTFKPGQEILYKVRTASYLHGNVLIADHPTTKRSRLYMRHRAEAVWLTEKLKESGILKYDHKTDKYISVEDTIDLPIDALIEGSIQNIGDLFGSLYNNKKNKREPCITDNDLVLLSTCLYPKDIINALAAELSICLERWKYYNNNPVTPIEKIPDIYKADNLYKSINNGKMKYFSFVEKEGLKRIKEIENQFNSSLETRIHANVWKQFWPENIEWDNKSIGESTRLIIHRLGQFLIWYNILFRLLFASCSNTLEKSEVWIQEAKKFCSEKLLFYKEFNNDKASKNIADQVETMASCIERGESLNQYYQVVVRAINWLVHKRTVPLLEEIDLYIDKHGKPVEVEHYGHIIFCQIKKDVEKYATVISSFMTEKNIGGRVVSYTNDGELPQGIWILLRINERKDIKKIVAYLFEKRIPFERVYVFTGLSDSLKIRSSKITNTRYRYGLFLDFFKEVRTFIDSMKNDKIILVVANEVNGSEKKDSLYKSFVNFERLFSKKINSELLFYDKISIKAFGEKEKGDLTMLYEWYEKQEPMSIFVSYTISEETDSAKIDAIVDYLKKKGINVQYYEDLPVGSDLTEFMRRIKKCNFTLIIGSQEYKEKAESIKHNKTGVSFEDAILSDVFLSDDRNKIVPVTFSDLSKTIPVPFNRIKGVKLDDISEPSLEKLTKALINAYKNQIS